MLLLLLAASATPVGGRSPAPPCKPTTTMVDGRQPARVRPLSAMPPGKLLYGVYHEQGGCSVPIVLREKVGVSDRR